MALKLYNETDIQNIADAIRALNGTTTTYTVAEMAPAIRAMIKKENLIPSAIASDGSPYNGGQGYKSGYRLNSSGNESALAGKYVTGFIPVSQGQLVTLKNMQVNIAAQDNNYIAFYDSTFTLLSGCSRYAYAWYNQSGDSIKPATVDGNYLTSFTTTGSTGTHNFPLTNVAYFRISCNLIDSTSEIYVE